MKFGGEWKNDAMEYSAAMRRIQPRAASPGSRLVRAAALVVLSTILAPLSIGAPLAYERIRDAAAEPHNWLTYSGNYSAPPPFSACSRSTAPTPPASRSCGPTRSTRCTNSR